MKYVSLTKVSFKRIYRTDEPLGFGSYGEFSLDDLFYYYRRELEFSTPFGKTLATYLTWLIENRIIEIGDDDFLQEYSTLRDSLCQKQKSNS